MRGREHLRVWIECLQKPALAGVCAAQRQLFGLRSRQKSEVLERLSGLFYCLRLLRQGGFDLLTALQG